MNLISTDVLLQYLGMAAVAGAVLGGFAGFIWGRLVERNETDLVRVSRRHRHAWQHLSDDLGPYRSCTGCTATQRPRTRQPL